MTQLFKTYLRMVGADNSEKRELINGIPSDLTFRTLDNEVKNVREYITTEAIESTTLVQAEFYKTVMEGAQPRSVFRNVLPIFNTKSNALKVTLGESDATTAGSYYVAPVPEGGEIEDLDQNYDVRTFTIKKYAKKARITNEMVDDGLYDVIELEGRKLGARIENQLNQSCLDVLLDNAGNEQDTAGSNQGVVAIANARKLNLLDHFGATDLIVHPHADATLMSDTTFAAYYGWGVRPITDIPNSKTAYWVLDIVDNSSTYIWEYDTDGDIGMLLLDAPSAGVIAMREDITLENYKDPVRDLVGVVCKMRYGANYLFANATCRIEY